MAALSKNKMFVNAQRASLSRLGGMARTIAQQQQIAVNAGYQ